MMPGGGMMGWGGYGYGMGLSGGSSCSCSGADHRGAGPRGPVVVGAGPTGRRGGVGEAPLDILKRRYARGEITKEDYDRIKQDLA